MIKILRLDKKSNYYLMTTEKGQIKLTEDVVIKYILSIGKQLTEEKYKSLIEDNNYYLNLNKLINILVKNMHSEKDIKKYLYKYKVNKQDYDKYISRLKELKLLDDYAFAREYVISKSNYGLDGPKKIKYALLNKGIKEVDICKALKSYPLEKTRENLARLISQELKTPKQMSFKKYVLNLKKRLLQKGYSYVLVDEEIKSYYQKLKDNCLEKVSIERDLEKLKALNLSDEEIKRKFFRLGYDSDLVKEVIQATKDNF